MRGSEKNKRDISKIVCTLFKNIKKVTETTPTTIKESIERIQSNEFKKSIQDIRKLRKEDEKLDERNHKGELKYNLSRVEKEKLPAIIPSGVFSKRAKSGLIEYKGMMAIDYDHIPKKEVEVMRITLMENPHVYTAFISPSGEGLKVLVPISGDKDTHKDTYLQWNKDFPMKYWDEDVHDYSRLMFLSWDPIAQINEDAKTFSYTPPTKEKPKKERAARPVRRAKSFENRDMHAVLERVLPMLPSDHADGRLSWVAGLNAIISEFGESGRALAHLFSKESGKYSYEETDKKFDSESATNTDNGATMATFAYWASQANITFQSEDELMFTRDKKSVKEVALDLDITEDEAKAIKEGVKEKVKTPVIALEFINDNYDFKTNLVNGMIESASTGRTVDSAKMYTDLMKAGYDLSPSQVKTICQSSEIAPEFDPIKDYFKNMDNVEVEGFTQTDRLSDAIVLTNEKNRKWFTYMFQKMMVRSVACGMGLSPNRTVFLLTDDGKQAIGKSTWLRYIGGLDANKNRIHKLSSYYLEEELKNDKDMDIAICENFIWNVEEYESLSPKELSKFKMTVSKATSKVRRPYATNAEILDRRCNFFASTNQAEMLSDSNNTRYIVFQVDDVTRNYQDGDNKVDMDIVWAEAYHKFKEDFNWGNLDRDDMIVQGKLNQDYKISDPLEDYIANLTHENGDWFEIPAAVFNRATRNAGVSRSPQHATKITSSMHEVIIKIRNSKGRFYSIKSTHAKVGRIYVDAGMEAENKYMMDDEGEQAYMKNNSMNSSNETNRKYNKPNF